MTSSAIIEYHQRTKHHLNGYAKGPAALDWDDQPSPFRHFHGSLSIQLPPPGGELSCSFGALDHPETIPAQDLSLANLGLLLELAFGLSAWKQYGPDRWALRNNPSSGNLHPTVAYVICGEPDLLPPGVYHYDCYRHSLEQRCLFRAASPAGVFIGLSSVHWREAWKYGERAFRYCQHDIGHALAGLGYAAAGLGWSVQLCDTLSDRQIAAWLGLDRAEDFIADEREHPDLICRLLPAAAGRSSHGQTDAIPALPTEPPAADWQGRAEPLGKHLYHWPVITRAAEDSAKPATPAAAWTPPLVPLPPPSADQAASRIIRQRRSAQHYHPQAAALPLADFHRIMLALLPNAKPPFSAWPWPPQVDLCLFVHNVAGLVPGLYWFSRGGQDIEQTKTRMQANFAWQPQAAPYPLYLLIPGNVKKSAKTLSCHQDIAGDSAFSLGMLASFRDNIQAAAWNYRRLFWECGLLGQILYLEAEAAGVRGTGIGCYFDDALHGVLGLSDDAYQSLYHFTIGRPLTDNRLQTLPPYQHLG